MQELAFLAVFAFIFGTIVGSFLNVVSLRFNTGKGIGGRSMCMSCGKTLRWMELIPLFSFLFLRGACRKCKSKISWQYPLVEFIAGCVFALILIKFPPVTLMAAVSTVIYLLTACLLVVIAAYDAKHQIIPDPFVYAFDAVALLSVFVGGPALYHAPHLATLLAGPALALPFALLWAASRGTWMGLGDAKLALGIGWILGMSAGVNAIVLAFWIGAAFGIAWMIITYKRYKHKIAIPFGPYLILAMYLVLLTGIRVIDVNTLISLFGYTSR
ncbi:MAG: prepilin peptidase leader peptidase (prepilin peptidase) / N-methyltransferase [Candidatus Parcubacteria bacterium]|nr:prepilin peptidase leader peptidase (prepilin peptidase) / N-methyltransferase [Candidatus Parcubacteria bacterium]